MSYRAFSASALVLLLAACGGGGGTGKTAPIVASGPPPATLGELAGTVFPLRFARIGTADGVDFETSRGEYSVEIVSDSELTLNTPEGAVTLIVGGGGTFSGTLNGITYGLEPGGLGNPYSEGWLLSSTDGMTASSTGFSYFGLETPQSQMDSLASMAAVASYTGPSIVAAIDGGLPNVDYGTANLLVDFDAGSVTGTIYETATLQMNIEGGSVSGNGIGGTLSLSGPDSAGYALDASDVDGQFYGLEGYELNGTFGGTGTGPSGDVEFVGTFFAVD